MTTAERCELAPGFSVSRVLTGLWQVADMERDGAPLDPDATSLALGSDFPVERADPREGLYAARTRQDRSGNPAGGWLPEQRLNAAEALAGFTIGAARAARQEDRRGRLAPGYFADLTVLDVDPLACEPHELLHAQVLMTVINGEVVYRAESY